MLLLSFFGEALSDCAFAEIGLFALAFANATSHHRCTHRELLDENAVMNVSPHLTCEEEAHPQGKVLRFAGEADFIAVPAVRQLLKKLLGQRIPFLIVDLSGVTFLNTPFWAAMQRYQIDGHPNSRLALCGMNEALKAAFDINGVGLGSAEGGYIAVYETVDSALAAAPSAP